MSSLKVKVSLSHLKTIKEKMQIIKFTTRNFGALKIVWEGYIISFYISLVWRYSNESNK